MTHGRAQLAHVQTELSKTESGRAHGSGRLHFWARPAATRSLAMRMQHDSKALGFSSFPILPLTVMVVNGRLVD